MSDGDRITRGMNIVGPLTELDRYALQAMVARGVYLEDAATDLNRASDNLARCAMEIGISLRRGSATKAPVPMMPQLLDG